MGKYQQKTMMIGGGILFGLLLILAHFKMIDLYVQSVIMFIGVNIIFATSLSIVNGYMGEFSCGHAGFMAVGAYVSSLLTVVLFTVDKETGLAILPASMSIYLFPVIIIIGGIAAGIAGLLIAIPSFKTRDDYLAIITIAVNFIIITALNNMDFVGGSRGYMGMKKVIYGMEGVMKFPYMLFWVITFAIFTDFLIRRFITSTYGKGIIAIKQDEVAAEIMSVDTNHMKLVAFMFSSGLAGISGGLFAHVIGYVNPGSFSILKSTEGLVMVYLAGMGSLSGSVISAILFTILLELLRPLQIFKWVIIPLILILVMQFRPEGLMGDKELSDYFPKLKKFYKFK
ncbi:MAG: branched-chain amino acid ABC transporter permease [Spirochaetes bacterium]|nr:MAG: branched-chain amino acid ABC transporter permease [Spirochaetota bacterium]